MKKNLKEATKNNPCPHCGKPDWCYSLGDLTVCNRDNPPSDGWYKTSKWDQDGHYYYAPLNDKPKKDIRPKQTRVWEYPDQNNNPLVRVIRIDDGLGGKPKRWQEKWDGEKWVKGLRGIGRHNIPIYRYQEIKEVITKTEKEKLVKGAITKIEKEKLGQNETIFVVEGEPCADALWNLGFLATTNIGGSGKWKPSDTEYLIELITHIQKENKKQQDLLNIEKLNHLNQNDQSKINIVLCPDRDIPGLKHMKTIYEELIQADIDINIQWLYAFPNSPLWNHLPPSAGLDVVDWVQDYQITSEDIFNSLESERNFDDDKLLSSIINNNFQIQSNNKIVQKNSLEDINSSSQKKLSQPSSQLESKILTVKKSEENSVEDELIEIKTHYTQMCIDSLYSDKPWIAIEGQLYQWNGKYYQKASNGGERKRIADWCNTTPVKVGKTWRYAYATPTHVDNIWRWLLSYFSIPVEDINPPGINCLNGVVKINWCDHNVSWELVPHNPNVIYTYVSEVNYDPLANSTDCDRLLSCLEAPQQKLFLKTIGSAIDLESVRKHRGREVRALLCQGHGNNGKDTLREAIRMLFGHTLTNATVSDFAAYDNGRKFSLAKLERASINWSSENSSFNNLDQLQSLKVAITGESLDIERKGVDEHEVMLNTVFLFNINEVPNLKAGMEAIQSRWAVLSFNKTYKKNADPSKGEIEADSRFRYDPHFLKEKVCPALLNKLLNALKELMVEGIDYSCTEEAIKDIQEETNHLWGFVREIGLDYQTGGRIYINDLWELLYKWYINNGTLEIVNENGKERKIWHDQVRRGDKNVKAPNQIYQRFSELFPKIKKERDTSNKTLRTGQFYLSGIDIKQIEAIELTTEADTKGENEAVFESQGETEIVEPINEKNTKDIFDSEQYIEAVKSFNSSSPILNQILAQIKNLSLEQKNQLVSILFPETDLIQ